MTPPPDPRADGPCHRMRSALSELKAADARCRAAREGERTAAHSAYRAAFEVYRVAQEECTSERIRTARRLASQRLPSR